MKFLSNATGLLSDPNDLAPRNGEALTTVFEMGSRHGHWLGESWLEVLQVASALEEMREDPHSIESKYATRAALIKQQKASKEKEAGKGAAPTAQSATLTPSATRKTVSALPSASERMGTWLTESGGDAIDRLFGCSPRLDGDDIAHFANGLVSVSQAELWPPAGLNFEPRLFALQRLVEMTQENMGRVRMIWTKLWAVVSEHLAAAAAHESPAVAMYAVDSLRQIASRLLRRTILAGGKGADEAFRPFEAALKRANGSIAKEMVIQVRHCVTK